MSKEYEITIGEKEAASLLGGINALMDNFSEDDLTWNGIYILHGAISGALNRYQSLGNATVDMEGK